MQIAMENNDKTIAIVVSEFSRNIIDIIVTTA